MQNSKFFKIPNYSEVTNRFVKELEIASKGEESTISFHKTYLIKKPLITKGTIQAIVIGGTNYEVTTIEIKENGESIFLNRHKGILTAIDTLETFNHFLEKHLTPDIDGLAMNFGFPLQYIEGDHGQPDATIIMGVKEHAFKGMIGLQVGHTLKDIYYKKHHSYPIIAVANDGVCLTQDDASMIIGTGIGMGIRGNDERGPFVAAPEPGDSEAFETTEELEEIDRLSVNSKIHRFEKMVSGKYLPLHYNLLARKHKITQQVERSEELSRLAEQDSGGAGDLARAVLNRSACYVACQAAGIYTFAGSPTTFTITVEGSLFLKGYKYQKSIHRCLEELGIKKGTISFRQTRDSSIKGAIKLLTT